MKNKIIFSLVVAIFLGISTPAYTQNTTVKNLLYLTENYPPHNYIENGELTGASIEILAMMWKRLNLTNTREDIKMVPWARGMYKITHEPNIVLFGIGYSLEREKLLNWVGPYYSHSLSLIGKKTSGFSINALENSAVFKVGVVREDIGHQFLLKNGFPDTSLDLSTNQNSLFKKLKSGRVDLICFMEDSAFQGMPKAGLKPMHYEQVLRLQKIKSGFGFSKQVSKNIIADFQRVLNELIQDGSVDQILKKYSIIEN